MMRLKKLYLRNFRNYSETTIEFSPKLNVFYGQNAMGKTNILEALFLLATGRSFRTPYLKQLIRKDASFFFIEAIIEQNHIEEHLRFYFDGTEKKVQHNQKNLTSLYELLGILPLILNAPQDVDLIQGSPLLRRRFLNLHISQFDPLYVHHWVRFYRAMKQRNVLLKNRDFSSIDCFEIEMAKSSEYIIQKRKEILKKIRIEMKKEYLALTDIPTTSQLTYQCSFIQKTSFLEQLKNAREKEVEYGFSLLGPHRDDFMFQLDHDSVKAYGSEGQKRSILYALRFSQWNDLKEHHLSSPIMAFDDFAMHFDATKTQNLKKRIKNLEQVFITLPQLNSHWDSSDAKLFHVEKGKITCS